MDLEFSHGYSPVHTYSQPVEESIENIPLYIIENDIDPVAFRQLNPWILHDYLEVEEGENYSLSIPVGNVYAPELAVADRYFEIAFED